MIELQGITKSFGTLQVLKGIDLMIEKGEVVSIVGPSGAGKTTLLQIMGTLDKADTGTILLNGTEVSCLKEKELSAFRNWQIGFVFQFHQLLPEFTALENVMMPALIAGTSSSEAMRKAKETLAFLGLSERASHKPAELSGGEKQRVAVARALINNPAVILADEPHGIGIALLADESDVARHVHIRRAAGHARHGVERRGADPVFDVGHIIVPEGLQPVEHEARGLKPDGAVGAVVNGGGAAAHGAEIVRSSAAIEDLLQKRVQPVQPHTAGNAFSAALRKTQLHERGSQIDRTAPKRRRSAAASERGIQLVHLFLRGGLLIDDQGSALPYI